MFGGLLLAWISLKLAFYLLDPWPALLVAIAVGLVVGGLLWSRANARASRERAIQASQRDDLPGPSEVPAVLQRLRELRDAGAISYAEYEESRHRLIDSGGSRQ
jgi:hypothetical protein